MKPTDAFSKKTLEADNSFRSMAPISQRSQCFEAAVINRPADRKLSKENDGL
jgi:hypothetical protein